MPNMRLFRAAVKPAFRQEQTDRQTDRQTYRLQFYIYIYIYSSVVTGLRTVHPKSNWAQSGQIRIDPDRETYFSYITQKIFPPQKSKKKSTFQSMNKFPIKTTVTIYTANRDSFWLFILLKLCYCLFEADKHLLMPI